MLRNQIAELIEQATACSRQGRLREAIALFRSALAAEPDNIEALHGLGAALGLAAHYEEALEALARAGELQPDDCLVHYNRGKMLEGLQRFAEALAAFDRAVALEPRLAEAHFNRALMLSRLARHAEALESYKRATFVRPDYPKAFSNRGVVLLALDRAEDALASCDQAIALQPGLADAHCNRGAALQALGRCEEALQSSDSAIALRPDYAEAYVNRGLALQRLQRYAEAMASYDKAIALSPDLAEAHLNKAHLSLLLRPDPEGWRLYEWRWKTERLKPSARQFPRPLWLGDEPLSGRTLLLHAEQGLGDVIQFVRYVPRVSALGAEVILEAPRALLPLLRSLPGDARLIAQGEALPAFDLHCPLMSLPLALRTTLESIPAEIPYLATDPRKRAEVDAQLGRRSRPRIGLAWAGNARHANDRERSVALRLLEPLLHFEAFEYHSLQKELRPENAAVLANHSQLRRHADELHDFSDTAALVEAMDLVIAADTAVAHLAGALGKPVWILLPWAPDWRWLTEREDSPWYPTARLFRQPRAGDWSNVIGRVGRELGRL